MSGLASISLVPFVLAFLMLMFRLCNRERMAFGLTFVLLILTVVLSFSYLILNIAAIMPASGPIAYGVVGVLIFAFAIARMFMI